MMRFSEAIREIETGKKVRHVKWAPGACMDEPSLQSCLYSKYFQLLEDPLNDWELYQEPERTYSFAEVVKGLKEGKKFRRKNWEKYQYIRIETNQTKEEFIIGMFTDSTDNRFENTWEPILKDFEAVDWVQVR